MTNSIKVTSEFVKNFDEVRKTVFFEELVKDMADNAIQTYSPYLNGDEYAKGILKKKEQRDKM